MFSNIKIHRLIARHSAAAYAVYAYVDAEINKQGYYAVLDDDMVFAISEVLRMDESSIVAVIDYCAEIGLIDRQMWTVSRVMTNAAIQARYARSRRRRKMMDKYVMESALGKEKKETKEKRETKEKYQKKDKKENKEKKEKNSPTNQPTSACEEVVRNQPTVAAALETPTSCETTAGDIDRLSAELMSDNVWIDAVANEYRIQSHDLAAKLRAFANEKRTDLAPYDYSRKHDFVLHFKRWLRIRIREDQKRMARQNDNQRYRNTINERMGITETSATCAEDYGTTF